MRFGLWTIIPIFTVLPIVNIVWYAVKFHEIIAIGVLTIFAIVHWVFIVMILRIIEFNNNGAEATCCSWFCSFRWLTESWKNSEILSNLRTNRDWIEFWIALFIVTYFLTVDFLFFYISFYSN